MCCFQIYDLFLLFGPPSYNQATMVYYVTTLSLNVGRQI